MSELNYPPTVSHVETAKMISHKWIANAAKFGADVGSFTGKALGKIVYPFGKNSKSFSDGVSKIGGTIGAAVGGAIGVVSSFIPFLGGVVASNMVKSTQRRHEEEGRAVQDIYNALMKKTVFSPGKGEITSLDPSAVDESLDPEIRESRLNEMKEVLTLEPPVEGVDERERERQLH